VPRIRACHDELVSQTVLIVDDHPEFRRSARALLEDEGFIVAGEARDGQEAVSLATRLRPDIVLLDIQLPDVDGFEVAERLAASVAPPMVVFISSRSAASFGSRLDDAVARGFIPKSHLSGAALTALVG
jgi:DNA-binding NarL/FixJ family response regulator